MGWGLAPLCPGALQGSPAGIACQRRCSLQGRPCKALRTNSLPEACRLSRRRREVTPQLKQVEWTASHAPKLGVRQQLPFPTPVQTSRAAPSLWERLPSAPRASASPAVTGGGCGGWNWARPTPSSRGCSLTRDLAGRAEPDPRAAGPEAAGPGLRSTLQGPGAAVQLALDPRRSQDVRTAGAHGVELPAFSWSTSFDPHPVPQTTVAARAPEAFRARGVRLGLPWLGPGSGPHTALLGWVYVAWKRALCGACGAGFGWWLSLCCLRSPCGSRLAPASEQRRTLSPAFSLGPR